METLFGVHAQVSFKTKAAHTRGAYPRKMRTFLYVKKKRRIPWRISCCLAGAYLLANNFRRIPWRILLAHTSGAYSEKQRETERDRERERERERDRDREREREIERERGRERKKERERERKNGSTVSIRKFW